MKSVNNPNSIHGLYPYRGKISAVEAKQIISDFPKDTLLLDPFCGSGTIIYEAMARGLRGAFGVDLNPLAGWLTEAKLFCPENLSFVVNEFEDLLLSAGPPSKTIKNKDLTFYFHEKTLKEIETVSPYFPDMTPYLKGAFCGAIALTARGCNGYRWTSSTVGKNLEEKRYISFFDKLRAKIKKHHYPIRNNGRFNFISADARDLSKELSRKKFDVIFTSPPYFDALDYTAYYAKILYSVLGLERDKLRVKLIQKASSYEEDMAKVLDSMVKITTKNAKIIFVVGDKKTPKGVINGGLFFSKLLKHEPNMIYERTYTNSSSQVFDSINKTRRKEQIVVWDKASW